MLNLIILVSIVFAISLKIRLSNMDNIRKSVAHLIDEKNETTFRNYGAISRY